MLPWKRKPSHTARNDGDTLTELLASEERLASALDAATVEAERILRDADEYARVTESACATVIEDRVAATVAEYDQNLEAELREIEARAAEDIGRFDAIDEARVNELAAMVLRRVAMEPAP